MNRPGILPDEMRYSTCQLRLADILFLERLFLSWHAYQCGGRRGLSCKLANRSKNSISAKQIFANF